MSIMEPLTPGTTILAAETIPIMSIKITESKPNWTVFSVPPPVASNVGTIMILANNKKESKCVFLNFSFSTRFKIGPSPPKIRPIKNNSVGSSKLFKLYSITNDNEIMPKTIPIT